MRAPPFIKIVAASGTRSTRYPICFKCSDIVVRAVVLPAHGPPVRQMRVMVVLLPFSSLLLVNMASSKVLEAPRDI